jgi:carbonic anhydrase
MSVLSEVMKANEAYAASFGAKSQLAMPPARRFAILTCMDARLDPAKYAGLAEGDAHVIRNAGGRASDDAIRSLVISYKLLGTREWFVIHHSDCGMLTFDDGIMSGLLEQSLETATVDEKGWHDHGHGPGSVKCIRSHPLVPGHIPVYGYYYDVKTGRLVEVPEAMAAGKAKA